MSELYETESGNFCVHLHIKNVFITGKTQVKKRDEVKVKKNILWLGITICLIAIGIIYPIENTNFLTDLVYTFSALLTGLIVVIYALSGRDFIKVIGFLVGSILVSVLFWFLSEGDSWGKMIPVIFGGIPSGLISGLLFLALNYYFKLSKKKEFRYVKQVLLYLFILLLVSILFKYGGDWYFDIFQS